ncbi:MAG: helix-turn-helix domain-containing protein [Chitinophagaceae bacterium]|nr:helix-turn-helix domain-containing protein [Chitinophagaceae bacterium]
MTPNEKYDQSRKGKKNWTQETLAEKIGVSRQSVNSIETGKFIPSTVLALKMAKVLKQRLRSFFSLMNWIDK